MTHSATDQTSNSPEPFPIERAHLAEMTNDLFGSMLGLEISTLENRSKAAEDINSSFWQADISIDGTWSAEVSVIASEKLAELIACTMFSTTPEDLSNDELQDAVGEVVNIVGGNIKGVIDQECTLSLPNVGKFESLPQATDESISFSCEGHNLLVSITNVPS